MNKMTGANLEFVREDDYVEYYIFPKITVLEDEAELRKELEAVRLECLKVVEAKTNERGYIWHKDTFQLQARTNSAEERLLNEETNTVDAGTAASLSLPPHLHGVTHYGDNITDEWFVVFLICELTRALPECIARICDADGEFLLIEAADVLPDWANPDTCEQRVYIVEGSLYLVQNSPSNTAKRMAVSTAVEKIRLNPTLYRVSKDIQTCIDERLKEFESVEATQATLHRQIVQLPLNAAVLLRKQPSLIASAVRAFCERDSLDTKALRTMRYFPPESQRVRTNVTFTRCLYAMLMHCQYTPERKIGWNLPAGTNTETYKEQLIGVKIASGLEILATQAKSVGDVEQTPAWRSYLRSLSTKGYFRENIEGSENYKSLLGKALEYFKANQMRFRTAPLVGAELLEILRTSDVSAEQFRDEENNLQASDSDDWLNISAEELDAMLLARYGPKQLYKSNGDINAAEFTKNLTDFLEKESNFEGIENDKLLDSDDDSSSGEDFELAKGGEAAKQAKEAFKAKVKKNHSMRKACQKNPLLDKPKGKHSSKEEHDDENASTHVRNFLDFVIPEDNWDSNSDMSDYEDEHEMEHNLDGMSAASGFSLDKNIKKYMEQMDRELANTTIGQSFRSKSKASTADEDDFDDIESFEPININVNTLKNMLDSYKSQVGGAGPVSNLFSAMGVGMSAAAASENDERANDLSESTV